MNRFNRRRKKNQIHRFTVTFALLLILGIGYFLYRNQEKPIKASFIGLDELPVGFQSYGIDISRYQEDIDWDLFFEQADSTISFVYCKATEGKRLVDSQYLQNINVLRKHQKKLGVYHFFIPSIDPQKQAEHFLNNYSYKPGDLPPVLDVETENVQGDTLIDRMKVWLSVVEKKTGIRPVIYTSYHFYKTKFKDEFLSHQFWIAKYGTYTKDFDDDRVIQWQYTDAGGIPGINGAVDLNFSKQKFKLKTGTPTNRSTTTFR